MTTLPENPPAPLRAGPPDRAARDTAARDTAAPRPVEASIVSAIGSTPLIALDRLFADVPFRVFAKVERFNPGGSVKDRTARAILERALKTGDVVPGRTTVVESTSGNLGIALAQLCAFFGVDCLLVTDPRVTAQNLRLMRAYGARVEVVDRPDPAGGEFLPARLRRVAELVATIPDAYWPDQYGNEAGSAAHRLTMQEIDTSLRAATGRGADHVFCTTGTCGTLRGVSEQLRSTSPGTTVWAVDAAGSAIFGVPAQRVPRRIPGHGAAVVPRLLRPGLADRVVHVDDAAAVRGCRELLRHEAVLAGGSSGAAVAAVRAQAGDLAPGDQVAVVLPDGGDRYLDTVYDDDWVARWAGPRGVDQ